MTAHYTLDWLNSFKLKDIHKLREKQAGQRQTILATATFVNSALSQLMQGKTAIWGIKENNNGQFLGTFSLKHIDFPSHAVTLAANFTVPQQAPQILKEVVPHVFKMLETDFKLQTIYVPNEQSADFSGVLAGMNFEENAEQKQGQVVKFTQRIA